MATIVHFDITVDDLEKAKSFYEEIFEWEFEKLSPTTDYYLIHTKGVDGKTGLNGGMGKRKKPDQGTTNFIGVDSIEDTCESIEQLGGKVVEQKRLVQDWGFLAICQDTDRNTFGIWEDKKPNG